MSNVNQFLLWMIFVALSGFAIWCFTRAGMNSQCYIELSMFYWALNDKSLVPKRSFSVFDMACVVQKLKYEGSFSEDRLGVVSLHLLYSWSIVHFPQRRCSSLTLLSISWQRQQDPDWFLYEGCYSLSFSFCVLMSLFLFLCMLPWHTFSLNTD